MDREKEEGRPHQEDLVGLEGLTKRSVQIQEDVTCFWFHSMRMKMWLGWRVAGVNPTIIPTSSDIIFANRRPSAGTSVTIARRILLPVWCLGTVQGPCRAPWAFHRVEFELPR